MLTVGQAMDKASAILKTTDVVEEFERFVVAIDNHVPESDSSANMVAVDRATGRCCNFVAVIPELGGMLHAYEVLQDGSLVEVRQGEEGLVRGNGAHAGDRRPLMADETREEPVKASAIKTKEQLEQLMRSGATFVFDEPYAPRPQAGRRPAKEG